MRSYVRQVAGAGGAFQFTQAIVRDAGHIVPHDQPGAAADLIARFVDGRPFA